MDEFQLTSQIGTIDSISTSRYKQSKNPRKIVERQARPCWADLRAMRAWYAAAEAIRLGGIDVQVDHIVPLRGKNVCGLDWEGNYQLLPKKENAHKNNKHIV